MPPGYEGTCLNPCDGSEELFTNGSYTMSLDNDGDLLVDSADPDCFVCSENIARVTGAPPVDYSTLQAACENVPDNGTIQINKIPFVEDLYIDSYKTLNIESGFDCYITSISGKSTVEGRVTIATGALVLKSGALQIQTPVEDCSDSVDNDDDGLSDCDDPDCDNQPPCAQTETDCSDCIDNDGNGLRDCDDSSCSDDTACFNDEDSCAYCHGNPPVDGNTLTGTTGSVTAGKHATHVNTKLFACENCHSGSVGGGSRHNSGPTVTMGFSLFGGTYPGGIYDGQSSVNYDSSEVNTWVSSNGSMICSNIYCHGRLPDGTAWGGGNDTTPEWDDADSVPCNSCHDSGGAATGLPLRHGVHTDALTYAFECESCHENTVIGSTVIKNQQYHVNNSKEVVFSAGGNHDSGTQACTNTYCTATVRAGPRTFL